MKKYFLLLFIVIVTSTSLFAVTNVRLNNQKELTITQLPADVVLTCDLAQTGNRVQVQVLIDVEVSNLPEAFNPVTDFFVLTDGIGWIRDPENPNHDLAGDETGIDGKITSTFNFDESDESLTPAIAFLIKLEDLDGSTDFARIIFKSQPQPPLIQGKVSDSQTGTPIPDVFIVAENVADEEIDNAAGISDHDGNFVISVMPGTWQVYAETLFMTNYQPSDTIDVTIQGTTSQTVHFSLKPYDTFISGTLTKIGGAPVADLYVIAIGAGQGLAFFNFGKSDANGAYQIGCLPGTYFVSPGNLIGMALNDNDNWPEDHYVEPGMDSVAVAAGQTVTSNFVFMPASSFITGRCTFNGVGIAGVEITAMGFDTLHPLEVNLFTTTSKADGRYRLGVKAGVDYIVFASKDGYEAAPPFGYQNINPNPGEVVSGKDFSLEATGTMTGIAGKVTFGAGASAGNVYVAAVNDFDDSEEGYLITYTSTAGEYQFTDLRDGPWQIGVFLNDYVSEPRMRYRYLNAGEQANQEDFVLAPATGIINNDAITLPGHVMLEQNFPNPFNPTTTIKFILNEDARVKIDILNMAGQYVQTLATGRYRAGSHTVSWDGTTHTGAKAASGIYFYQVTANNIVKIKKMILAK